MGFNLLLTPTVWEAPATLESMKADEDRLPEPRDKFMRHVFFTQPFNQNGAAGDLAAAALDA